MAHMPPEWHELDRDAQANLTGNDLTMFFRYRDELHFAGVDWRGDAEYRLRGYIWDTTEARELAGETPPTAGQAAP